ncbi:MAG: hypothetical protein JMDDDDMK_03075 [Acidobacteria bacterium]|nr:hypothetical protein [Acidobacteriota bacterium]
MQSLWQDLRFGARMLLKRPGFTAVAVLILALGIGANSAIFSVINGVILRPLDYADPDRLVVVWEKIKQTDQLELAPDDYFDYRDSAQFIEHLAASDRRNYNLTGGDDPVRIEGAAVTASLFPALGVAPALGRTFSPEEDRAGADPVVVLSYGLWQRRFGGDPKIIGRAISLSGAAHTVIGVMPASFQFPPPQAQSGVIRSELWTPRRLETETGRNSHSLFVIGRLKPGVTMAQAKAGIETIAARRQQTRRDTHESIGANTLPLGDQVARRIKPSLMALLGAVGIVLLIACANVANLLLLRAASRRKEIAIRAAMGAGRARLLRQLMIESLLLALLGGGAGLLIAYWGVDALLTLGGGVIPRADEVTLDARVLGFTLLISLLTGVIFGLIPALRASGLDLNEALRDGGRISTGGSNRLRGALVVAEVALALVMLIGAGLLIKSFWRLQQVAPGFNAKNLLAMETSLASTRYDTPQSQAAFFKQALERINSLPGVQSAAIVNNPPLSSRRSVDGFLIEGRPEPRSRSETPLADYRSISPDYFRAMNIPISQGRAFTEADAADAPPVAIVNEAVVRRYWPNESPIGRRIKMRDRWQTIVGVVGDVRQSGLDAEASTHVYMPFAQNPQGRMGLVIRTSAEPMSLAAAVRNQIGAIDKDQPVYNVQTMERTVADSVSPRRLNMLLLGILAAVALALALTGIYAIIAYSVAQRTREIGVRIALGAQRRDVMRLVVGHGMSLALLGVAVGLALALGLTRFLSGLIYDVSATDPATFAAVVALLAIVALVACYIPARRATKVDPMIALRCD